jgi:uncharacterized protein YecE (DUF72 family)
MIFVGTAGWRSPRETEDDARSHLERYALSLNAVEINSSFYREHRAQTYRRWADSTPEDFRFSVKLWREFTHNRKLVLTDEDALAKSIAAISHLGDKLSVILVQIPPSLKFDHKIAEDFFLKLRRLYQGAIAFEPRHKTWLEESALALLEAFNITKVRADPERCPLSERDQTRLEKDLIYFRLHGSPEIYKSKYTLEYLSGVARQMLSSRARERWCIFDNTTFGYSLDNSFELRELLNDRHAKRLIWA